MEKKQNKLFLLDAFALIYRAFFGFGQNQRYNSKGVNTTAVMGFANALLEVIEKQKPTHIAVVFDPPGGASIREAIYSEYKANRDEMPDGIREGIPYIQRLVEGFNIQSFSVKGYEADDVIGTLARHAANEGFEVYMMTPDKDFGQLVTDRIKIFKPGRRGNPPQILGVREVCERFDIQRPEQVIDILGMMGDNVDNIPGIPGIGEKTAIKLIKTFGSMEGLLDNVEELKGKQKENVIQFAEQGLMSKQLATIDINVPIEVSFDKLELHDPDKDKLMALFEELEFRNLSRRVLGQNLQGTVVVGQMELFPGADSGDASESARYKKLDDVAHNYHLVSNQNKVAALAEKLLKLDAFCFDTETTGLNPGTCSLVGISISAGNNEAWYIPVPEDFEKAVELVSPLKEIFRNDAITKVAQNLKFDLRVVGRYGLVMGGPVADTMLAHYLIAPEERHNMDYLAQVYLHYQPISIEELIGKKGASQGNMRDVPVEKVVPYACEDADITWQLWQILKKEIENENFHNLFYNVEMPLCLVLASMEDYGIRLDIDALNKYSEELGAVMVALRTTIYNEANNNQFNLDSPKQLGTVLFEQLKIVDKPRKTRTGQYATGESVLSSLKDKHPIIEHILDYRMYQKLKSTYVDALPKLVNAETGRLHTNYQQAVTATGRLSSSNPNLQNIPIRTAQGRAIRKSFVPENEAWLLLSSDYSQIELRIMASFSEDEEMIRAFNAGEDIHRATAARVFDIPQDQVSKEQRSRAKSVNFGIIYGQTAFGLAQSLNIPRTEAAEIIDQYFNRFPKVKEYMDQTIKKTREKGFATTILGRRRNLNDINAKNQAIRGFAERNAINSPIQGSAADIIKLAMIHLYSALHEKALQSRMLLQVHDELVLEVKKTELELVTGMVKECMENAWTLKVPLVVEMNAANNWLDAH